MGASTGAEFGVKRTLRLASGEQLDDGLVDFGRFRCQDEQLIEALAPDAPQKPLAHRIHQGCAHRRGQDANPGALGNAIEVSAELIVSIADDDLRPWPKGVALRSCCAVHCWVGARVTATCLTRLEFTSTMKNAKIGRKQMS
jgi:hypothetical protein